MLLFIEQLKANTTLRSLNVANNRLDEKIGKAFVECLKVNYSLINLEFSFNQFEIYTVRKIQEYLKRNKAKYDAEMLQEWNERRLMRDEDAGLHKLYLQEATTKEAVRMEEQDIEEKYEEIQQDFREKDLQSGIDKFNLIEMLEDAAKNRKGKKKGRKGKGGKKKKGM